MSRRAPFLWTTLLTTLLTTTVAHAAGRLPGVVKKWSVPIHADRLVVQSPVLYIKSGGRVTAVTLRSGRQVWSRDLGEDICCVDDMLAAGSSVVVAADGKLFFLDAADGSIRFAIDLGDSVSALAGPPVVALLSRSNELLAVDPDSGQVTGRLPLSSGVEDLAVQDGALVVNAEAADEGSVATAGFEADTLKEMWRIETPSVQPQLERIGGRLHLARWSGELVPLDPESGRLGRPLPPHQEGTEEWPKGLPHGHELVTTEGLVIVAADDEVAAFSTAEAGAPEDSPSVDAEVSRILLDTRGDDEPLARGPWIDRRLQALAPWGTDAWPAIERLLPRLGPTSLVAAADALAVGGDRTGAPALARRLAGSLEEPLSSPGLEGWNPQIALLRALARLGGDPEVPAIAALIDDHTRRPVVRREALATLAAMGSPAADRSLRALLARPLPPPAAPPSPNARLREPVTQEQEIAVALFRHLFQFESEDHQLAIVVSDVALDWRGRAGPTITLDTAEAERFLEKTGGKSVPLLSFRRGEPPAVTPISGDPPGGGAPPLQPDEEVFTVTVDRGLLHPTVIDRAVLRNLNAAEPSRPPLWAVRSLRTASIGYMREW